MRPTLQPGRFIWIPFFFAVLCPAILEASDPRVIVDLHAHRAEIRAALLQHTPIGSSTSDVVRFVSQQLQHPGAAPATVIAQPAAGAQSKRRGVKSIRVSLGQYYDHPEIVFLTAPLLMQKDVSAQWAFDEHDRLIDIFVDKNTGVY